MKKLVLLAIIFLLPISAAFAQTSIIRGKVMLTNPNRNTATIAGAKVELYRTDVWAKLPATHTNSNGEFIFAGVPLGGTYAVFVSGQGLAPDGFLNVKAGNENVVFKLIPGDGSYYPESAVQAHVKTRAEIDLAEKQEPEDFNVANQLLNEEKYEAAIAAYDAMLKKYLLGKLQDDVYRNQAFALNKLAVKAYNASIQSKNDTERPQLLEKAVEYTKQAVSSAILSAHGYRFKAQKPGHKPTEDFNAKRTLSGFILLDSFRLGVLIRRDSSLLPLMKTALDEYLQLTPPPGNRAQAMKMYAESLDAVGDCGQAVAQYSIYLKEFPDDFEAFHPYAKCIWFQGELHAEEKTKNEMRQTSANYFQKFLNAAPADHRFRRATIEALQELKDTYKITPLVSSPQPPAKTEQPAAKPTSALGMWRLTLTFEKGSQSYALFLEKNGAVSGGRMFQIQGSDFVVKGFRQVGNTVSFTAMFGKVPVAFQGTIDRSLMNMKGTLTGVEKGKRTTIPWNAARENND